MYQYILCQRDGARYKARMATTRAHRAALNRAITELGGITLAARYFGVTVSAVQQWRGRGMPMRRAFDLVEASRPELTREGLILLRAKGKRTKPAVKPAWLRGVRPRLPRSACTREPASRTLQDAPSRRYPRLDRPPGSRTSGHVSGVSTRARALQPATRGLVQPARSVLSGSAKTSGAGAPREADSERLHAGPLARTRERKLRAIRARSPSDPNPSSSR